MTTLTGHSALPYRRLQGRDVLLAALFAMATGVGAALAPKLLLALVLCPAIVLLVLRFPEPVIAMFLTSGLLKGDPVISALVPFDLTVALAGALLLAMLVHGARHSVFLPRQALALLPMLLSVAWGIAAAANAYGAEKAIRFIGLTSLAIAAPVVLLDERKKLTRFLVSLAAIGVWASIAAARTQEQTHWGRLTAGGNPIPLGRAGAAAFVFAWLRLQFARQPFDRVVAILILGITAFSVMSSGSRGPVLSAVVGMAIISMVTYRYHRRSPIGLGPLLFLAVLSMIAVSFVSIPEAVLHRFEQLFNGEGGSSVLMRGFLYATAWHLMLQNPLGIGIGGFERYAPLELRYPHNLFLEVGCELGWVPLLSLLATLALSLLALVKVLKNEYSWQTLFLGILVVTTLLNSMVSGDLNDNRNFFAALLLPFVALRLQSREARPTRGSTGP